MNRAPRTGNRTVNDSTFPQRPTKMPARVVSIHHPSFLLDLHQNVSLFFFDIPRLIPIEVLVPTHSGLPPVTCRPLGYSHSSHFTML